MLAAFAPSRGVAACLDRSSSIAGANVTDLYYPLSPAGGGSIVQWRTNPRVGVLAIAAALAVDVARTLLPAQRLRA